jgi:hypothetical protein
MSGTADNPRQSAGHLMRKAAILERLTVAILALLLVAGLVLAIRYDIERTRNRPSVLPRRRMARRLPTKHRQAAKLAYDPGGGVTLLFGGSIDAGTWAWDGANWKEVADIGPGARHGHALSTSDGGVILFGGAAPQAEAPASRGDTWAWLDQSWRQIQDIGPAPRQRHAMAYDPTGAYRPLWRRDGGRSLRGRHLGTRPAQLTSLADKTQSSQLSA